MTATITDNAQRQDLMVAKMTSPIESLIAVPERDILLALTGNRLIAIKEAKCIELAEQTGALDFEDGEAVRVVAEDVQAFSVGANGESAVLVSRGRVLTQSLVKEGAPRVVTPLDIGGEVEAVAISGDGREVVCIVRDDSHIDLAKYNVLVVNTEDRTVTEHSAIGSALPPTAAWSQAGNCFLVFDPIREALWRIATGAKKAQRVELPNGDRSSLELCVHPTGPWVALVVRDVRQNRAHLLQGAVSPNGLRWEGAPRLDDGIMRFIQWHPSERALLSECSLRRRARLEICNPFGSRVETRDLPRGWNCDALRWSADGQAVFATSGRQLAIWRPANRGGD